MKTRNGFVSNSSSSSFVICKYFLSEDQIIKIFNYYSIVEEYVKEHPLPEKGYYDYKEIPEYDFTYYDSTQWNIKESDTFIYGETSMDNFDFDQFLNFIGLNHVEKCWDEGWSDEPSVKQLEFIKNQLKKLRKDKLTKIDIDN